MPSKARGANDTCPVNNKHVWIPRSVVCVGSLLELETHSIAGEAKEGSKYSTYFPV